MGEIKYERSGSFKGSTMASEEEENSIASEWFLVVTEDGRMHCSCGRSLNKMDDGTYKCAGGLPIYRPADGEVHIDKFGNMMLAVKPHPMSEEGK